MGEISAKKTGEPDAVQRAMELRGGAAPDGLLTAMLSMLANRGGALLAAEEEQFIPLLQDVAGRCDKVVRRKLAEQIARMPQAPRGLYEFIARDEIDVAAPLLMECEALDDEFLIEVVEQSSSEYAKAVAQRPTVSSPVSAAIVGTGAEEAIILLLHNPGAEISASTYSTMVADCATGRVQGALVARDDLPAVIAHRLFWNAASAIRQQILERFPLEEEQVDELLDLAVRDGLVDPAALNIREDLRRMTAQNTLGLRLSISDIISFIKSDNIDEFVKTVSIRLGIRPDSVRKILQDQGGEPLAVLCRALYADRTQFTSVLLKNDYQRFGLPRPPGQIEQISKVYDRVEPARALATVRMWDVVAPAA